MMAEFKPLRGKLVRLTEDGAVDTSLEPVEFDVTHLQTTPLNSSSQLMDECVIAARNFARFDVTFQMVTKPKHWRALRKMMFADDRSYRRDWHYHKHRYTHAPKKRNKHGRVGVRNRRSR